ncbi:hypothetical protein Taro_001532 [Colocasia esculenta]|uniref:Retrotransposon gag domain-containing protein n=1 Tax=Colocasia esculenta TaxID=4460 RepID=A0A843TGG7_COLES|nr:hypothetical protein [Colocasia esculenta]
MAPRRRSQARQLVEQQDESDMPAQGRVQEEVSLDESVAQPQGAQAAAAEAAAAGGQQQEYHPQPQQYADWFPMAEQFFRAMYQGAWQPGRAAAGVLFPVPPPVVPEQQQQFSEVFHGEYFSDYARRERRDQFQELVQGDLTVSQYHQRFVRLLRHVPHVAGSDQACAERFIAGLRPDLRWGVTAHMCTTLGEAVAKATALDREAWQPQQQHQQQQGGASSRSSPYQHPSGSCLLARVDGVVSRGVSPGLQSSQYSRVLSRAVRSQCATLVACQATLGGIALGGKLRSSSSQCNTRSSHLSTSTLPSSRHCISSREGSTSSRSSSFRSRSSTSRTSSSSSSFRSTSSRRSSSPSRRRSVDVVVVARWRSPGSRQRHRTWGYVAFLKMTYPLSPSGLMDGDMGYVAFLKATWPMSPSHRVAPDAWVATGGVSPSGSQGDTSYIPYVAFLKATGPMSPSQSLADSGAEGKTVVRTMACESLARLSWLVWDAEDSLECYPAQASQSFFSLPRSLRPRNRESSQQRQGARRAEETGR